MFILPQQNIPSSKKTKEWHAKHVKEVVSYRYTALTEKKEQIQKLINAYLCVLTEKENKIVKATITNQYQSNLGVPYTIYPLIESKIEQLIGIYKTRPLLKRAYSIDKRSIRKKFEHKIDLISEELFREANEAIKKEAGIELETEKPNIQLPDDVEEFMEKEYMAIEEENANDIIQTFLEVNKNRRKIEDALRLFLITDETHSYTYEDHGKIMWNIPHPLEVIADANPNESVNADQDYFSHMRYMSESEILNNFDLDKSTKTKISNYFISATDEEGISGYKHQTGNDDKGWFVTENNSLKVAVVQVDWKSQKTVSYKKKKDKFSDKDIYFKLSEKDKVKKNDEVEKINVQEHRFCVMLGPDVVLDYGEREYRNSSVDNKTAIVLDSVSLFRQNHLGPAPIRSVAAKLYKLQEFASELFFEFRLSAKKISNGKKFIYDTAQTPKQYLKKGEYHTGVNRMLHHMKKDDVIFINSKDKTSRHTFNQFTSIDLSSRGAMQDILNALNLIEHLADKWIGLTAEAQGQSKQYATATATDRNMRQSITRLETYFGVFDEFVQSSFEKVLYKAKTTYNKTDTFQRIYGDLRVKILKLSERFFMSDIGMYFGYPNKDQKKKEIIDRAAEMALGTAQAPEIILTLIELLEEETTVEAKAVLKRGIKALNKLHSERSQQEQQMITQQTQQQEKIRQEELAVDKAKIDAQIEIANINKEAKLEVKAMEIDSKNRQFVDQLLNVEKENAE